MSVLGLAVFLLTCRQCSTLPIQYIFRPVLSMCVLFLDLRICSVIFVLVYEGLESARNSWVLSAVVKPRAEGMKGFSTAMPSVIFFWAFSFAGLNLHSFGKCVWV